MSDADRYSDPQWTAIVAREGGAPTTVPEAWTQAYTLALDIVTTVTHHLPIDEDLIDEDDIGVVIGAIAEMLMRSYGR